MTPIAWDWPNFTNCVEGWAGATGWLTLISPTAEKKCWRKRRKKGWRPSGTSLIWDQVLRLPCGIWRLGEQVIYSDRNSMDILPPSALNSTAGCWRKQ